MAHWHIPPNSYIKDQIHNNLICDARKCSEN